MQNFTSQNANLILDRLKSELGIRTDLSLANHLGVRANTISTWRSRNTLDHELIISKCDVNLNALFKEPESNELILSEPKITYGKCQSCAEKEKLIESQQKIIDSQLKLIEYLEKQIPTKTNGKKGVA